MSGGKKATRQLTFGVPAERKPIHRNAADSYQQFVNTYCEEFGEDRRNEDVVKEAQRMWNEWDEKKKLQLKEKAE